MEDNAQSPTITLPIHEFLEYSWGYKDKSVYDKNGNIADTLRANPNPSIFHIVEDEKTITVWRAKDWELEAARHYALKAASDSRVENWNLRCEIKEELKRLIEAKMGNVGGISESFSESVVMTYNIGVATAMGASPELCAKIETLKQRK